MFQVSVWRCSIERADEEQKLTLNLNLTMKVVPVELVKELHGKMCKTNGSPIFGFNRKLDVQYAYHTHIVNPRIADPSEQQVARSKQKKANPTEWEAIKEGFKNQSKYKLLWNYAFSVIYPTIS